MDCNGCWGFTFRVARAGAEVTACSDGADNDGDGLTDLADPGCAHPNQPAEKRAGLACDDGVDNDGDGWIDFIEDADGDGISDPPGDPGCRLDGAEAPACQDGISNDGDGLIDFDGGQSIHGACGGGTCPPGVSDPDGDGVADPDPQCAGKPWKNVEARNASCGLGWELSLALLGLRRLRGSLTRRG
jgi:hypothetical protein